MIDREQDGTKLRAEQDEEDARRRQARGNEDEPDRRYELRRELDELPPTYGDEGGGGFP